MSDNRDGPKAPAVADPAKEIIQKLSPTLRPEKRNEAERVIATFVQKLHVGPIPAPEDLAHYEHVCPGAADRILGMAESDGGHRRAMERDHLTFEYRLQRRGQLLAIAALLAMLAVIAFTFYMGQPIAGSILGGGVIIAVVGMFLRRGDTDRGEATPAPQPQRQGKGKRKRR